MINILIKLIAAASLLIISPIILLSMILIYLEDGYPVNFIQERLGKNQKYFFIYKLRTMKKNTPNRGTHEVNLNNYLNIGIILRKFKIDELPQVLNYIKGDLNLVGPRPGLPSQKELTKSRMARNIFDIKPGITGLSQVLGYDMSNPELLSKVDLLYINNQTTGLKIDILIATFFRKYTKRIEKKFIEDLKIIKGYDDF